MFKRIVSTILTAVIVLGLASPAFAASQKKYIALTFDDGPGPYTSQLLDILKQKNVKATFFVLGSRAVTYPKTLKRINDEGHQIALHSYSHANFRNLSQDSMKSEIQKTKDAITNAIGTYINEYYFRPPYGAYNQLALDTVNMPFVTWTVDSRDWENHNGTTTYQNVVNHAFDGAIVLQHDIQACNLEAVPKIIDTLRARGYEFVTVAELFQKKGKCATKGNVYGSVKTETIYDDNSCLKLSDNALINDIPANSWYTQACKTALENGLMSADDNLFYPACAMTRGEAVGLLYKLAGSPAVQNTSAQSDTPSAGANTYKSSNENLISSGAGISTSDSAEESSAAPEFSFYDVPESNTAVYWAASIGVTDGYPDNSFRPDVKLTRQDFACFYYRYELSCCDSEGLNPSINVDISLLDNFTDSASISSYARQAMCYMVEGGLMEGSDGKLMPQSYLTRAQVCKIIENM